VLALKAHSCDDKRDLRPRVGSFVTIVLFFGVVGNRLAQFCYLTLDEYLIFKVEIFFAVGQFFPNGECPTSTP
jgi:hypothetical protein